MSIDTILTGFTGARPNARSLFGGQHFEAGITLDTIRTELFNWEAIEGEITATAHYLSETGVREIVTKDPTRKAIMRSDTGHLLGVMKSGYRIHQFDEWLGENVATVVDDAEVLVQSAGTANHGAQAWVQIATPENVTGPGGFVHRPFILAATSLDGSIATCYKRNDIAIICENTYRASLKKKVDESIKIKHTRNSEFKAGEVREALQILWETGDAFNAELEELLAIEVSDNQFRQLVEKLVTPTTDSDRSRGMAERKAGELWQLWRHDERAATWNGTGLGAMQAVSTWRQQIQSFKGGSREQRNAVRLLTGVSDREDLQAYDLIREVVSA